MGQISFKPYSSIDGDDDASIGSKKKKKNNSITRKRNKKRNLGSLNKEFASESSKKSEVFSEQTSSGKK